jgi:hypothetical protein
MTTEEARKQATALVESVWHLKLEVPEHGVVYPMTDGAFVEVWLWVPEEKKQEGVWLHICRYCQCFPCRCKP